jgi:hypothetical protein
LAAHQPYKLAEERVDSRFGFRQPIVVDEHGVIIVGHTRYKAALKLGRETVPVHVAVGPHAGPGEGQPLRAIMN